MIQIKRAYDKAEKSDGYRVLIDGLWPRGIKKEEAVVDLWLRQIAPNPALRKWFHHDPEKFPEFSRRYKEELKKRTEFLSRILSLEKEHGMVTLLYGAKDRTHNNAVVLLHTLQGVK